MKAERRLPDRRDPRRSVAALSILVVVLVMIGGCSSAPPTRSVISTGQDRLRTFTVISEMNGDPVVCPAFGLEHPVVGTLRGDSAAPVEPIWLEGANGRRLSVVWPGGFAVRFDPTAALVNERGVVVAHAGDAVTLGQVRPDEHTGTFEDPYVASGIVFDGCYPYIA